MEPATSPRRAPISIAAAIVLVWTIASYQQDFQAFTSTEQFGAGYVINNSKAIQSANIPVGIWLHDHAPAGMRLAAWDIGAIGYFSRLPIVDLYGLTDDSIARLHREPHGDARVEAYLETLAPELIATHSEPDSSVTSFLSGRMWLFSHYRYHSQWRHLGVASGPRLLVRNDVVLQPR
jgi:hypothetical protein